MQVAIVAPDPEDLEVLSSIREVSVEAYSDYSSALQLLDKASDVVLVCAGRDPVAAVGIVAKLKRSQPKVRVVLWGSQGNAKLFEHHKNLAKAADAYVIGRLDLASLRAAIAEPDIFRPRPAPSRGILGEILATLGFLVMVVGSLMGPDWQSPAFDPLAIGPLLFGAGQLVAARNRALPLRTLRMAVGFVSLLGGAVASILWLAALI